MGEKPQHWMCSACGRRLTIWYGGRPSPGTCPAKGKTSTGFPKPHSWKKI